MFKSLVKIIILITLISPVSACGPATTDVSPTVTNVPPSPTAVPPTVMPTDIPPTEMLPTAMPAPASTDLPPTTSPTNTPALGDGVIAFASKRDGNAEIYTMNADGTGRIHELGETANVNKLSNRPLTQSSRRWSR